jgi:hypothetical protein
MPAVMMGRKGWKVIKFRGKGRKEQKSMYWLLNAGYSL